MNVKKFYDEINGSYENALAIMMNDVFIAKLLTKFMESNTYEQIVNFYDKKDYRSLFVAAHSYKGVAGNLSLTPLYEITSTITELTRNNDNVNLDNEIQEFKTEYSLIKEKYFEYIVK